MRNIALRQYRLMQEALLHCSCVSGNTIEVIECASGVCRTHWHGVKVQLIAHHFESDKEEIRFFKEIKPLFTSEIEFYNLLLHACLFQPNWGGAAILERFWKRESERLEKFKQRHRSFVAYYEQGNTALDRFLFLRRYYIYPLPSDPRVHALEQQTATRADILLGNWKALEKYNQYVQVQLTNRSMKG